VVDHRRVDPNLGTWEDIGNIGDCYDMLFDGVFNHCSSRSRMFKEILKGNPEFKDFFIVSKSPHDLTPDQRSKIFPPRTSDILTEFHTIDGPRYVWTTFSADQIDLNFTEGVRDVVNGVTAELARTMKMVGAANLAEITPGCIMRI
jgi:sucrose phosphorylase